MNRACRLWGLNVCPVSKTAHSEVLLSAPHPSAGGAAEDSGGSGPMRGDCASYCRGASLEQAALGVCSSLRRVPGCIPPCSNIFLVTLKIYMDLKNDVGYDMI